MMKEHRTASAREDLGRTTRFRTVAQAAALVVAPWGFVVANAGDAWTTRGGEDDLTARGALDIAAAHPDIDRWATFAAMMGCLLLVPAVLGAMNLVRYRAARLGLVGGVLMIGGYICYFALCFQGYATIAMAEHGGTTADHLAVLHLTQDQPVFVATALTFVLGNLVGTVLLGLALMRAHVVPTWAGLCLLAWPVLHFAAGPWGEVAGAVVEAVGLAVVGSRLLATLRVPAGTAGERALQVPV